jgi:hypothetical protein
MDTPHPPIRLRSPRQCLAALEYAARLILSDGFDDRSKGRALTETASRAAIVLASGVDRTIEKISLKHRAMLKELELLRDENCNLRESNGTAVPGGGLIPIALPRGHYPNVPPPDVFDAMVARSNEADDVVYVDCKDGEDNVADVNQDDDAPEFTDEQRVEIEAEQAAELKRRRGGRPRKNQLQGAHEISETPEAREERLRKQRENSLFHKALKAQDNDAIRQERVAAGLPKKPMCTECHYPVKLDGSPCRRCFPPSTQA